MSLVFPGSAGNGLIRTSSANPATAALTVCAFIRPVNNVTRTIWAWRNANRDEEYKFGLNGTGLIYVWHNGAERAVGATANINTDYFVAMTISGATITTFLGLVSTNSALSSWTGTRTAGTGNPDEMYVGQSWGGEHWNGGIQSLRIFTTAMVATGTLASEQKRQIPREWGDLWAWYRMLDTGTNEASWDRSGNGRDLTEVGAGSGRTEGIWLGQGYNSRSPKKWTRTASALGWTIVQDPTIAAASTARSPTVTLVALPGTVASGSVARAPRVDIAVAVGARASSASVPAPAVVLGVAPGTVAAASAALAPTVTLVALPETVASAASVPALSARLSVTLGSVASASTAHAPSVTASGPATTLVGPGAVAAASAAYSPAVGHSLAVGQCASATTVRAPSVRLSVTLGSIAAASAARAPSVAPVVGFAFIAPVAAAHAPHLDQSITIGFLSLAARAHAPGLWRPQRAQRGGVSEAASAAGASDAPVSADTTTAAGGNNPTEAATSSASTKAVIRG